MFWYSIKLNKTSTNHAFFDERNDDVGGDDKDDTVEDLLLIHSAATNLIVS